MENGRGRFFSLLLAGAIVVSPGVLVSGFVFPGAVQWQLTNIGLRVPAWQVLALTVMCGAAVLGGYRSLVRAGARGIGDGNRAFCFLLALPVVSVYRAPGLERTYPFYCLFLAAIAAVAVGVSAIYWSPSIRRLCDRVEPAARRVPDVLAVALVALTAGLVIWSLALRNLRALHVSSYDLAIYVNCVWNTSHGEFLRATLVKGGSHVAAHFDPILALLVPIYRLYSGPESLVLIQSLALAAGSVPLYLIARTVLGHAGAFLLAVLYLLHPGLHGIAFYEFHSLALVVPLIVWLIYAIETSAWRQYWAAFVLILLVREEMPLLLLGAVIYLADGKKEWRIAAVSAVIAVSYLLFVKLLVMPDAGLFMKETATSISFRANFARMIPREDQGALDLLVTLVANPAFALQVMVEEKKLLVILLLGLPVLFIPIFAGARCVMLIYGTAFLLLSSGLLQNLIYNQYNAVLTPFLFALTPFGIDRVVRYLTVPGIDRDGARRGVFAAVTVASLLVTWKFGALVPNEAFQTSAWSSVHWNAERSREGRADGEALQRLLAQVPPEASVAATLSVLPYVADRRDAYVFVQTLDTDFMLIHRLETYPQSQQAMVRAALERGDFTEVAKERGLTLYRRVRR